MLSQSLVLCLLCSAHDTGLVTLQVAISNQIISSSVVFEYKARALPSLPSSQHDWLSLDGRSSYQFSICIISATGDIFMLFWIFLSVQTFQLKFFHVVLPVLSSYGAPSSLDTPVLLTANTNS